MLGAVPFELEQKSVCLAEASSSMSPAEFRLFVEREGAAWLRLAVRLAGAADGPDVLQEALVKAWISFNEGSGPVQDLAEARRWVVRIVVNQAYDAVRARGRRQRWAGIFRLVFPESTAASRVEVGAALAEIERHVNGLTPEQRVTWILKEVEGYSGAEIAELTGVSEGAVEQRLLRARLALQRILQNEA